MILLDKKHIITGDEFFRQRLFNPYDSDNYAVATFIGCWTSIRYLLGNVWKNKSLGELSDRDNDEENYYHAPSFFDMYEFISFESDEEFLNCVTYNDNQVQHINKRMYCIYRDWTDWDHHLINHMSLRELNRLIDSTGVICPYCKDGILIERNGRYGKFIGCTNFPKCKHSVGPLQDLYTDYKNQITEFKQLKNTISQIDLKKVRQKFLVNSIKIN
jgi:ssDNA-binding Zn-finger/Zn-ribbon topoisomerase 1